MTDASLNYYVAKGTAAQRAAFTPSPATPAAGPAQGYYWFETDTGLLYAWTGAAWQKVNMGVPLLTILQRSTNQSVANNTTADVSWTTTVVQDDVSAFSAGTPTQVTVPSGCTRVKVTASGVWATNNTGQRGMWLVKNGTIQEGAFIQAANETPVRFVTDWLTVAAADILKLQVFQTSGGALNFFGSGGFFARAPYVQFEWAKG